MCVTIEVLIVIFSVSVLFIFMNNANYLRIKMNNIKIFPNVTDNSLKLVQIT